MKKFAAVVILTVGLITHYAPANAEPIGTGSTGAPIEPIGTGSTGAPIESPGNGSPDYTKPDPEPEKGTPEHSAWEAGERARIANLIGSTSVGGDKDEPVCSDDTDAYNYCNEEN